MPPNGKSRPGQAAPPNATDVESITLRELPMFEWRMCPQHEFLGVSVLVIGGQEPTCFPHGSPAHSVDAVELGAAR